MINTVSQYDFVDAFNKMGRGEQFSYEGLIALYDYLEMLEEGIDQQIELDVIAICCEYSEYDNLKQFKDDYGREFSDIDKRFKYSIDDRTTLIKIEGTERFIIQQF
tara:strand:+ start:183 stop:500 length:318 start_codon:yes stop_codon:yes gene_type:complete